MPLRLYWDGKGFAIHRAARAAWEGREVGWYKFLEEDEWSDESRSHYFARLRELYDNLPEGVAEHFSGANGFTHFRKWCLIREGFRRLVDDIYPTTTAARQAADNIRRHTLKNEDYAFVETEGRVLRVWYAKSQA